MREAAQAELNDMFAEMELQGMEFDRDDWRIVNLDELPQGYLALGAGYSYASLRVGLALRHADGREVYFQPGDNESAIRDTIDALDEVSAEKRDMVADIAFADYF